MMQAPIILVPWYVTLALLYCTNNRVVDDGASDRGVWNLLAGKSSIDL